MSAQLEMPGMPTAAVLGDAEQARHLLRLPPPLPVRLRRSARPRRRGPPWAHNTVGSAVHAALRSWWDLPVERRTTGAARQLLYSAWSENGFRDAEQSRAVARPRGRLADRLRRHPRPHRRAGRQRTHRRRHHRAAGPLGPDRPDRPARRRTRRSSTTRPAGCPAPTTRPAGHRRWPPMCSASAAHCAGRAPGRAAPPAQRHRRRLRAHRPLAGQPRAPRPRTSPTTSPAPPRPSARAPIPTRRSRPSPGGSAAGATSGPVARPAGGDAGPGDVELPRRGRRTAGIDRASSGRLGRRHALEPAPHDRRAADALGQPQHRLPERLAAPPSPRPR